MWSIFFDYFGLRVILQDENCCNLLNINIFGILKNFTEMKKRPYTDVLLPYLTRQKCARSTDFVNVIC